MKHVVKYDVYLDILLMESIYLIKDLFFRGFLETTFQVKPKSFRAPPSPRSQASTNCSTGRVMMIIYRFGYPLPSPPPSTKTDVYIEETTCCNCRIYNFHDNDSDVSQNLHLGGDGGIYYIYIYIYIRVRGCSPNGIFGPCGWDAYIPCQCNLSCPPQGGDTPLGGALFLTWNRFSSLTFRFDYIHGPHKQYIQVDIIFNYMFHFGLQEHVFRQVRKIHLPEPAPERCVSRT